MPLEHKPDHVPDRANKVREKFALVFRHASAQAVAMQRTSDQRRPIPSPLHRLRAAPPIIIVTVLLLSLGTEAFSGFKRRNSVTIRVGGEKATKAGLDAARKKGVRYPPIEEPLSTDDLVRLSLFEPFKSLPNAAARQQMVNDLRERFLCSFAVIGKEFNIARFMDLSGPKKVTIIATPRTTCVSTSTSAATGRAGGSQGRAAS